MNHITEANRYIDNAKEILKTKAFQEDGYYKNTKYVKMAGHTAYAGVLVALDGVLGNKKKGRKNVDWYKEEISKLDKKILQAFISAYDTLHLAMSYDGNPNVMVSSAGIEDAETIISWASTRLQE